VVARYTRHLHQVARLGPPAHANWGTWWLAVVLGYLGLALMGWYAVTQDRRSRSRRATGRQGVDAAP
jgi:hypothetical protein